MRGANNVAIVLLVAVGGQAAAGFDQDGPQHALDSGFMPSVDKANKILQSRLLRASRDLKNDSMLSAGDEERTPLPPSKFLTMLNVPNPLKIPANAMRMEGEVNAIEVASKTLSQLRNTEHQHFFPTRNEVPGHVRPDSEMSLVSVANDRSLPLPKKRTRKRPTVVIENVARPVTQHDYQFEPLDPSRINDKAPSGRLYNQLITQKALQLDKNEQYENLRKEDAVSFDLLHLFEESALPGVANRQEASAIREASKKWIQLESTKRKRIAPTPDSAHFTTVNRQETSEIEVHSKRSNPLNTNPHHRIASKEVNVPPDPDKFLVLVANNLRFVLAKRLKKTDPTAIMNNAARFVMQHFKRLPHLELSTTNPKAPSGRLDNQPITLQLDKNQHVDDVGNLLKQDSHTAEHLIHLSEDDDESAHFMAAIRQTVPENWSSEFAKGPKMLPKDTLNYEVKEVHKAFLEAFHLPFHLYPQETAIMLRLVRREQKSSPNNVETYNTLRLMALHQKDASHLRILLDPDLKKFLGVEEMVLSNNLEKLREALNVKLVILYDLFFEFCHERKDLVKGLPPKPKPLDWILKLSTSSSGNKNNQHSLPRD